MMPAKSRGMLRSQAEAPAEAQVPVCAASESRNTGKKMLRVRLRIVKWVREWAERCLDAVFGTFRVLP